MQASPLHVVAAVIYNSDKSQVLISRRAAHQDQGNLWEFPGGKRQAGESRQSALARELDEELGIGVSACEPLMELTHDYPDKQVRLDVWQVTEFTGTPEGREQQPVRWVELAELGNYPFPAANLPILQRLADS